MLLIKEEIVCHADLEYDVTEKWLNGALRYENYSDFGTTNYKLASLQDNINLRGAISTGFRAPSLQIYFLPLLKVGYHLKLSNSQIQKAYSSIETRRVSKRKFGFTAKIPEQITLMLIYRNYQRQSSSYGSVF
jgi:iron complex outermembrane receptor protein